MIVTQAALSLDAIGGVWVVAVEKWAAVVAVAVAVAAK